MPLTLEQCRQLVRYAKENGRWVTLEEGQHVFISDAGEFKPRGPSSKAAPETVGGRKPELVSSRKAEVVGGGRKTQIDKPIDTPAHTQADPPANNKPDPIAADDPRKAAEEDFSLKYDFARESAVPNAGEDLADSARHKRNRWKSLEDAEREGTAEELVTRDQLLKNEPLNLLANVKDNGANALASLAAHVAMNKFPKDPSAHWTADRMKPEEKKELRALYVDAFRQMKAKAEELAQSKTDPREVLDGMRAETRQFIDPIKNSYKDASDAKRVLYNLMAGTHNALLVSGYPKASQAHHQVLDFASRLKKAYGGDLHSLVGNGPDKGNYILGSP